MIGSCADYHPQLQGGPGEQRLEVQPLAFSLATLPAALTIPLNFFRLTCRVAQEVEAGRLKMRQTKGGMDRTDGRPAGAAAAQKAE